MVWLISLVLACTAPKTTPTPGGDSDSGLIDEHDDVVAASVDAGIASLIHVAWTQPAAADALEAVVHWSLPDEAEQSTPPRAVSAGPQQITVLGAPFSAVVSWRLEVDGVEIGAGEIETGAPPGGVRDAVVISSDPAGQDPTMRYLLTSLSSAGYRWPTWTVIVDRQGRLVWARQTPDYHVTMHPRIAADGTSILVDENTFWGSLDGTGAGSEVQRLTLDGVVAETFALPGLHHAYTQLPDGTLIWGAVRDGGATEVLMARAPDGVQTEVWSCADFFAAQGEARACGSNTVSWSAASDTILYSLYSVETVVEVDWRAGTALRWFGHLPGAWAFADAADAFWWQHGAHFTPEGTLLVSARTAPGESETVVREYALDPEAEVLRQVWSFGLGDGVYGAKMGDPWRLPGGNIVHNYGSTPRIREGTAEGQVVWDIGWTSLQFIGRSIPLEDLYVFLPPP